MTWQSPSRPKWPLAMSRRSIRFLSNGFHLTAPFSSNNTEPKKDSLNCLISTICLPQPDIFVKSGIAFNTFERERKYETCLMSLLYERCFQLYEGYKLHEFMSTLSTVCNLKQRTTAGTQIRSALSRKAHHEQTVYWKSISISLFYSQCQTRKVFDIGDIKVACSSEQMQPKCNVFQM